MALINTAFRAAAINAGHPDQVQVNAWFADRQTGRWANQTVRQAFPPPGTRSRRDILAELDELHAAGVVTDAEFERLRGRLKS
jgi:hypothetical protein